MKDDNVISLKEVRYRKANSPAKALIGHLAQDELARFDLSQVEVVDNASTRFIRGMLDSTIDMNKASGCDFFLLAQLRVAIYDVAAKNGLTYLFSINKWVKTSSLKEKEKK